jgi:hypothetical protein
MNNPVRNNTLLSTLLINLILLSLVDIDIFIYAKFLPATSKGYGTGIYKPWAMIEILLMTREK